MPPGELPEIIGCDPTNELAKGNECLVADSRVITPSVDEHDRAHCRFVREPCLPGHFCLERADLPAIPEPPLAVRISDAGRPAGPALRTRLLVPASRRR